jgi:hypothetical protein
MGNVTETTHRCPRCGEIKPDSDFRKNPRFAELRKDSKCSKCRKEVIRECPSQCDGRYAEKQKETGRRYYWEHRDERLQNNAKWHKEHPVRRWASSSIHNHKCRKYKVSLTIDEVCEMAENTKYCPICGVELVWGPKEKAGPNFNSPSLDRKYNGNRLSIHNTWILCYRCNLMKNSMPLPELVEWCKEVVRKFDKEGD